MAKIYYNDNGTWKVVNVPGGGSGGSTDPTTELNGKSLKLYQESTDQVYIQFSSGNIQRYITSTTPRYTYQYPLNSGTLTTENSFKTLFGNKSIVGSGNIDLYLHRIKFESVIDGTVTHVWLTVPSSKNLKVDSLTDLKTLLGNTFEYSATGYSVNESVGDVYHVCAITESSLLCQFGLSNTSIPYPVGTWTDTVTTV